MKGILGWLVLGYLYYLLISGKVVQFIQVANQPKSSASSSSSAGGALTTIFGSNGTTQSNNQAAAANVDPNQSGIIYGGGN